MALVIAHPASAKVEQVTFDNAAQYTLYQSVITELRCPVCQNQSIHSSNAELAGDLRRHTRELVLAGKTRAQIIDYMAARYGDFILYRPRVKQSTLLLWLAPFVLIGGLLVVTFVRLKAGRNPPTAYSPGDLRRAEKLIDRETAP